MHISNFNNYLGKDNNSRIIFSAPFGMGKTTFLKKYFKEYSNKYECFHLFPVNYQVASNEDVFELLKYDILNNIVQVGGLIEATEKIGKLLAIQSYLMYGGGAATINLFSNLLKLGTKIDIKSFIDFSKDAKKHYNMLNEGDGEKVEEYLNESKIKAGSIYEFDSITEIICEANKKIKEKNKKSVLVLDDLDRIDPSQIFRILNLFSAHFDSNGIEKNKFGFDKIILVCDYENIKNIFSHLYGEKTDFTGYINKFMSYPHYSYSIVEKVTDYVLTRINDEDLIEFPNVLKHVLKEGFTRIINNKQSNLRNIQSILNNEYANIIDKDIEIKLSNEVFTFSSIGSLTKMLSCINLLGCEIDEIFNTSIEFNTELFNLVGPFWLKDTEYLEKFLNYQPSPSCVKNDINKSRIDKYYKNEGSFYSPDATNYCKNNYISFIKEIFDEYIKNANAAEIIEAKQVTKRKGIRRIN
jgi:hypothetical protein